MAPGALYVSVEYTATTYHTLSAAAASAVCFDDGSLELVLSVGLGWAFTVLATSGLDHPARKAHRGSIKERHAARQAEPGRHEQGPKFTADGRRGLCALKK